MKTCKPWLVLALAAFSLAAPVQALGQSREGRTRSAAEGRESDARIASLESRDVRQRGQIQALNRELRGALDATDAARRRAALAQANLGRVAEGLGLPPSTPPEVIRTEAERFIENHRRAQEELAGYRQTIAQIQNGAVRTAAEHLRREAQTAFDEARLADAEDALTRLAALWRDTEFEARGARLNTTDAVIALAAMQDPLRALDLADAAYEAELRERDEGERRLWTLAIQAGNASMSAALSAPPAEGNRLLLQAVERYRDRALRHVDRDRRPADWAETQNNLGIALQTLGARSGGAAGVEALNGSVAAFEAALQVPTERDMPVQWAATQNNLGGSLRILGERSGDAAGLETLNRAVTAYKAALRVFTERDMPAQWAVTQTNLGNTFSILALSILGERSGGLTGHEALKDAVAAHEAALRVFTERDMPAQWAMTQTNLGSTLGILGAFSYGSDGLEALNGSVVAFEAALRFRTERDMPIDWAMTQNNLGNASLALGEREGGTERLEAALAAYRGALRVFEAAGTSHYVDVVRRNISIVEALIAARRAGR